MFETAGRRAALDRRNRRPRYAMRPGEQVVTDHGPRSRRHRQRPHRRAGQSARRGSCGGAFRASTAIRCSAACSPATRRRASPTSCSTGCVATHSEYVRNTALVTTVLTDRTARRSQVTDFAPRFEQFGRTFRPPQLDAHHRADRRACRASRIRFRPTAGYGQPNMQRALRQQSHPLHRRRRRDPR